MDKLNDTQAVMEVYLTATRTIPTVETIQAPEVFARPSSASCASGQSWRCGGLQRVIEPSDQTAAKPDRKETRP